MATTVTKSGAVFVDGVRQWGASAPTAAPTSTSSATGISTYSNPAASAVASYSTPTTSVLSSPTPSVPQYNFTQTPAQNAAQGNNLGYSGGSSGSGSSGGSVTTPTPVQPIQPQQLPQQIQQLTQQLQQLQPQQQTPQTTGWTDILKYLSDRDAAQSKRLTEYKSQYATDIATTLAKMMQFKNTPYNPNDDASLKVAQDQARLQTINDMAKRGRVFDTYADTQMQQASQRLIPQYEQLNNQKQQEEYSRLVNTVNSLSGIENQKFNQYQGGVGNDLAYNQFDLSKLLGLGGLANTVSNTTFNQGVVDAGLTGTYKGDQTVQEKQRQFTNNLTLQDNSLKKSITDAAQLGYYIPTWAQIDIPEDVQKQLAPYSGNYAQFAVANPDSPLAQYAKILSIQKMFKDPKLLEQYGQQFRTEQSKQLSSSMQTQKIQQAGLIINNAISQYNLEKVMPLEVEKAKVLIDAGRVDLALKEFENSKAPEKFKAEMTKVYSDIANDSRQLDISQQKTNIDAGQLGLAGEKLAWEKDKTNPDNMSKLSQIDSLKNDVVIKGLESRWIKETMDPLDPLAKRKVVDYNGIKKDLETMQNNKVDKEKLKLYASYFGIPFDE